MHYVSEFKAYGIVERLNPKQNLNIVIQLHCVFHIWLYIVSLYV